MRLTRAKIDFSRLKFNYLNVKNKVSNRHVMAVVKADAYGHGMVEIVEALEKLGNKKPSYYGVALLEEAIELRKSRTTKTPILLFAPLKIDEINFYLKYKIIPTVTSKSEIVKLSKSEFTKKLKVHVNIDTGMGRVGLPSSEAVNLIVKLTQNKMIQLDGIYTHFATSDETNKNYANFQLKKFNTILQLLQEKKIRTGVIHSANSGAILNIPESYFDMVRVGIALYGYYPSVATKKTVRLKPVLSLVSEVATITKYAKGSSISYGRKYKTKIETNIISVPVGYADGIKRGLTNKMFCIIKNKKYPQVGTITMDRIMFDVGNDKIKVGDKVVLIGNSKSEVITAQDWCNVLKTIPYEITCGISKRVPREYV